MTEKKMDAMQGHWVLARLGKRILRPGGMEMTRKMLEKLNVSTDDDVVEFAPGLGYTARLTVAKKPRSYTAVELNEEAAALVRRNVEPAYPALNVVTGNAADTGLPDSYATKVYGEAMLTMQSMEKKDAIVAEAARILKPGGRYGIHEIALQPAEISDEKKHEIRHELQMGIRTSVHPLTRREWEELLGRHGMQVEYVYENGMLLLEPKRMIDDEGLWRFLLIQLRMLFNRNARQAVLRMRSCFRKYRQHLTGITIVARKM